MHTNTVAGVTLGLACISTLKVFTLTSSGPQISAAANVAAKATNAFVYSMPAQSVSVLVPTN